MALVPRLGPLPRGWLAIPLLAVAVAWLLCLPASASPRSEMVGGPPDIPGLTYTFSQIALRGPIAWSHSRMIMYPSLHDLYGEFSFPGDGLAAAPFTWLLGWPAGFTVFSVLTLATAGAAAGLLAARWWRSLAAGLIAVPALETSGVVLREIGEGRLTHVLGLALAPVAVAWFARGLVEDRGRWSFAAGVTVGLSALVFWYQAVWVGLMLLVVFAAGAWERLRVFRHTAWGAAGSALVATFPLMYTVLNAGAHPGSNVGPWDLVEEIPGEPLPLITLQEMRDVGGMGFQTGAWALRPLLVGAVLLGLSRGAPRRVLVPAAWIGMAWALGNGPLLNLPGLDVFSPIILQSLVPMLRRYWWPDRYLLVASVGVAILAGGGVADWVRRGFLPSRQALVLVLCGALLLTEARLSLRTLPMRSTPTPDPARIEALRATGGPLLVVPMRDLDPRATNRVWASDVMIEQIAHQRPLLAGPMNPESVVAGELYQAFWATGVLREIRRCEGAWLAPVQRAEGWQVDMATSLGRLYRLGLREILADPGREGPDGVAGPWRSCLQELLGEPVSERLPFRVYEVPAP